MMKAEEPQKSAATAMFRITMLFGFILLMQMNRLLIDETVAETDDVIMLRRSDYRALLQNGRFNMNTAVTVETSQVTGSTLRPVCLLRRRKELVSPIIFTEGVSPHLNIASALLGAKESLATTYREHQIYIKISAEDADYISH